MNAAFLCSPNHPDSGCPDPAGPRDQGQERARSHLLGDSYPASWSSTALAAIPKDRHHSCFPPQSATVDPSASFGSVIGQPGQKTMPNSRTSAAAASGTSSSLPTRKCSARRLPSLPLLNPSGSGATAGHQIRASVPALLISPPVSTRCDVLRDHILWPPRPCFLPHLYKNGLVGKRIRSAPVEPPSQTVPSLSSMTRPPGRQPLHLTGPHRPRSACSTRFSAAPAGEDPDTVPSSPR
jgi:hypothetical protein